MSIWIDATIGVLILLITIAPFIWEKRKTRLYILIPLTSICLVLYGFQVNEKNKEAARSKNEMHKVIKESHDEVMTKLNDFERNGIVPRDKAEEIRSTLAKVYAGHLKVSATHNASVKVAQYQTIQVFGDMLSISVQTIKPADENPDRLIVYTTVSAPEEKSANFFFRDGTCLSYAGFAIRVISISNDSANFFVSDEKPCE